MFDVVDTDRESVCVCVFEWIDIHCFRKKSRQDGSYKGGVKEREREREREMKI